MTGYKTWWDNEGSGMRPLPNEDTEEFARRITAIAWSNGAYVERNTLAAWMIQFGFATGHGDTMEELVDALGTEIVDRIDGEVEAEREACAKKAGEFAQNWWSIHCDSNKHMETTRKAHDDFCALQSAIRARGQG